jgi:LemA protein
MTWLPPLLFLIGAIVAATGLTYLITYNRLVDGRQRVADAWGAIEVELQRRHLLIPKLVESVKAAAVHERDLLTELSRRNEVAIGAHDTPTSATQWEPPLASAVADVIALREKHPALNAQQNFLRLHEELSITEDRLAAARRYHNMRVARQNTRVAAFPSNLIAGRHGFGPEAFYDPD